MDKPRVNLFDRKVVGSFLVTYIISSIVLSVLPINYDVVRGIGTFCVMAIIWVLAYLLHLVLEKYKDKLK